MLNLNKCTKTKPQPKTNTHLPQLLLCVHIIVHNTEQLC